MKKLVLSLVTILFCCMGFIFSGCNSGHQHQFSEQIAVSEFLKSSSSCTNKALYYKSCACGKKGTETFEYGELDMHSYVNNVCHICGDEENLQAQVNSDQWLNAFSDDSFENVTINQEQTIDSIKKETITKVTTSGIREIINTYNNSTIIQSTEDNFFYFSNNNEVKHYTKHSQGLNANNWQSSMLSQTRSEFLNNTIMSANICYCVKEQYNNFIYNNQVDRYETNDITLTNRKDNSTILANKLYIYFLNEKVSKIEIINTNNENSLIYTYSNYGITTDIVPTDLQFTITYKNTKNATNSNVSNYTIETDTIQLQNLSDSYYEFLGWFIGETKVTQITKGTFGDIVLTAEWKVRVYTITYQNTMGATNNNKTTFTGLDAKPFEDLQPLELRGYIFEGWYCVVGDDLFPVDSIGSFIGNATIKAVWLVNNYNVNLQQNIENLATLQGIGNYVPGDNVTITAESVEGYIWLGWYNGDILLTNELSYNFIMPSKELTYTAKWKAEQEVQGLTSLDSTTLSGWYLLNGTLNESKTITVDTELHLILSDNCNWTLENIVVPIDSTLYIYALSNQENMGCLTVTKNIGGLNGSNGINGFGGALDDNATALGGDATNGADCGTIIINGGKIKAINIGGGNGGVGGDGQDIGRGNDGGNGGNGGTPTAITINSGSIEATIIGGGKGGTGGVGGNASDSNSGYIGGVGGVGGNGGASGIITINGGTIIANTIGGGIGGSGGQGGNGGYSNSSSYRGGNGGYGGSAGKGGSCTQIIIKGGYIEANIIGASRGGSGGLGGSAGNGGNGYGYGGQGGAGAKGGAGGYILIENATIKNAKIGKGSGGNGGRGGYGINYYGGAGGNGGSGGTIVILSGTFTDVDICSSDGGEGGYGKTSGRAGSNGASVELFVLATQEDFNNEGITLTSAEIYYYSEEEPASQGNYWHYDTDGVTITKWA